MNQSSAFVISDIVLKTLQPISYSHHGVKDGLPTMVRGLDADGRPQKTVYIPAGQFRGRLRHEAAFLALREKGEKVRLEEAYMLALGQDLDPQEDKEPEAVRLGDQIKFRQDNHFLDLFGTWKVASRLYVSHFMPAVNVEPERVRYIRRDLDANPQIMELLDDSELDRMYDRQDRQSLASKAGGLIKQVEAQIKLAKKEKDAAKLDELEAKLKELEELKTTHKGGDDSENTKHLVELPVIPAGIELLGKLTVQRPLPADLKLLVHAVAGISLKPMMGAQHARGCGEIEGKASFRTTDGEVLVVVSFGGFQPAKIEWTAAGHAFMGAEANAAA